MPSSVAQANYNGFLLPFLNGVLNTKNLQFIEHSPENFNTHIIPNNYNKKFNFLKLNLQID
jgi:phage/plasmid-associated DNA primase